MNNSDPDQAFNSNDMFADEMSDASCSSASVLLERIERSNNEAVILCNVIELCQLLVMGSEETLSGFPMKQSVPCLTHILRTETNFEISLHACRALQYLIEVLPRSTPVVVEAIPALLEKLQVVECVDVAEQSLQVLDLLSKKHSKAILKQNGIASCLKFIDFFSSPAQRTSLSIISNCCLIITREDFHLIRDSLPVLSNRLLIQDKRSVESTCLCFSRLVENLRSDSEKMEEVAAHNLFRNLQQLLLESPSVASSSTFVTILHMVNIMSASSSSLHLHLIRSNIGNTLLQLLIGPLKSNEMLQNFELVSRSAQEIFEIISLIGNLLPPPPQSGIFSINSAILSTNGGDDHYQEYNTTSVVWQWCDSKGSWHSYLSSDCRIIEVAQRMGEPEIGMSLMGRMYTIDFQIMQQINEETGTSRPVQRNVACPRSHNNSNNEVLRLKFSPRRDANLSCREEMLTIVASLLPVVYEIFCTTASLAVKHKCLQTLLRMVLHSDASSLRVVLKNVPISSSIAGMLTSYDSRTMVTAIQLCHILMERLPEVFTIFFQRQGVLHQMLHLAQTGLYDPSSASSSSSTNKSISYPKEQHTLSSQKQFDTNCQSSRPAVGKYTTTQQQQSDLNLQRSKPSLSFLTSPPPSSVQSTRYNKSSSQVRFQLSEGSSGSTVQDDASLFTMSTPTVFQPRNLTRGTTLDDTVTTEAVTTAQSPTSMSYPSSPSINAGATTGDVVLNNAETTHRNSIVQIRLTDILKSKKSNYRLLKEEPSLFRFGPIQSDDRSYSTTNRLPNSSKSCRDYSAHSSVSASPPHHHSTPSVYLPSRNLGSLVSQRIASISSASSSSSSSSVHNNNHFSCNGDKSIRSPPTMRHQSMNHQQNSNSYVSATKARLFGSKEQQLTPSNKSSSLTFPRSLLASLNPKKWAKFSTSANQKNPVKEFAHNRPNEPLQKKAANSKEVINMWIIQNASLFMDKYFNRPVQSYPHPSLNILSQLSSTLLNLGNIETDEKHLVSLSRLLSINDISPFELTQSSFIDLMTSYLTSDLTGFHRHRLFLHVFTGCPKSEYPSAEDTWSSASFASHSPIHHLTNKLLNCFHHLEKFQLKTSDHSSAFRSSLASDPNTYRFYKADLIKCSLQLHPSCSGITNHWNVGLVRINPFAIVQSMESILTQTIKIADSDLSDDDDDDDDFEEVMNMDSEHDGTHSMSSSSSSSSLSSSSPSRNKGFEFFIGNNIIPEGMTVYQAIKRFSVKNNSDSSVMPDRPPFNVAVSPALNREHQIWSAEHTIWFKPKGLTPLNPVEQSTTSKSTSIIIHPRKAKFEPSITIHQHNLQLHRHRHFQHHHHHHLHHHGRHRPHYSQSSKYRHNYQHMHLEFEAPSYKGYPTSSSSSSSPLQSDESSPMMTYWRMVLQPLSQQQIDLSDPSVPVLVLLRIIHSLVTNYHLLYKVLNWSDIDMSNSRIIINTMDFISNKLTSKLMKQLQDPIVLLSGSLPVWLSHLPIVCPFLLSFQTRHHLFCLICLDKGRALLKFNERSSDPSSSSSSSSSAGDGHLSTGGRINCRVERIKKVVKRRKILDQAEYVMSDIVGSSAILEIKYDEEIGFGLGPTLEFYALVSQDIQRSDLDMWISCHPISGSVSNEDIKDFKNPLSETTIEDVKVKVQTDEVKHVFPPSPFLHPKPLPDDDVDGEKLKLLLDRFEFLGRFMAKSLVDSRLVDLSLSPMFYKWLLGEEHMADLSDLRNVDVGLYGSLMKLQCVTNNKRVIENSAHLTEEEKTTQINKLTIEGASLNDLCITFTLPGYEGFELLPGGINKQVTIDTLGQYIGLVVHWMLVRGIHRQMSAFKLGFETFLPLSSLQFFYADELDRLFCGSSRKEEWSVRYLSEVCRPDHGFNQDSPAVQLLYALLSSFDGHQQRKFIQFVTGSPRLPVGGLKSLSPPLTIVRKTMEHGSNPDDFLPSVMTCVNYLKLPDYSTLDTMQAKLDTAMTEGCLSFHLS